MLVSLTLGLVLMQSVEAFRAETGLPKEKEFCSQTQDCHVTYSLGLQAARLPCRF